jgi:hypothetical protein
VARIASRRAQGSRPGIVDPAVPVWGRAFGIRVEVPHAEGMLTRDMAVRLTENASQPYWLLSWRNR